MAHKKKKHGKPAVLNLGKSKPKVRAKGRSSTKSRPAGRRYR